MDDFSGQIRICGRRRSLCCLEYDLTQIQVATMAGRIETALAILLSSGMGFQIHICGSLGVWQLEDGRFAVFDQRDESKKLHEGKRIVFGKAMWAINWFMKVRSERKLGFDYEIFKKA